MQPAPELLETVRSIAASVGGMGSDIESTGRLPEKTVDDLRAAGVFAMWLPRELGGTERAPADVIDAVEMLSAADGSTGWCTAVAIGTGASAAYLPEAGAREIFPTPSIVTGGTFNPVGRAVVGEETLKIFLPPTCASRPRGQRRCSCPTRCSATSGTCTPPDDTWCSPPPVCRRSVGSFSAWSPTRLCCEAPRQ